MFTNAQKSTLEFLNSAVGSRFAAIKAKRRDTGEEQTLLVVVYESDSVVDMFPLGVLPAEDLADLYLPPEGSVEMELMTDGTSRPTDRAEEGQA